MTQYQATQQLHETVQSKAKELGLKSVDVYNFNNLIQEPQLQQIFVAFEEKFGENPEWKK